MLRFLRQGFAEWRRRRRERAELVAMSDDALRELGHSPADREWLARAPFWRSHPFVAEESAPQDFPGKRKVKSIAMSAPRGKAATPMTLRAGSRSAGKKPA